MIDVYMRECLVSQAERSITADDVTRPLDRLVNEHGVPAYPRKGAVLKLRVWIH
ncbi:MAG: hypothetical protein HKL85_08810 [Acidimicrobiaceae bacterium]|nr:hypothetical protein [Acidimicrobiaceae bacterium]